MAQLHVDPDPFLGDGTRKPTGGAVGTDTSNSHSSSDNYKTMTRHSSQQQSSPHAKTNVTGGPCGLSQQKHQQQHQSRNHDRARRANTLAEFFPAWLLRGSARGGGNSGGGSGGTSVGEPEPADPPLPATQPGFMSDTEAFVTWRPYAYIVLRNVSSARDTWHIRILNYNGTVANALNASVRLSLEIPPASATLNTSVAGSGDSKRRQRPAQPGLPRTSDLQSRNPEHVQGMGNSLCPQGYNTQSVCSGRGFCHAGQCVCDDTFEGRSCESKVFSIPDKPFKVHSEQMVYFRYRVPFNCSVATMLRLIPSSAPSDGETASWPILIVKRKGENGGKLLRSGTPLPTTYDIQFSDRIGIRGRSASQIVVRRDQAAGDTLYMGVFNHHWPAFSWFANGSSRRSSSIHAQLIVFPCNDRRYMYSSMFARAFSPLLAKDGSDSLGGRGSGVRYFLGNATFSAGLPDCPLPMTILQWDTSIPQIFFPLMLGALSLLTMLICLTAWTRIFQYHFLLAISGFFADDDEFHRYGAGRPGFDQLSDAELNFMFPAFSFAKLHFTALSVAGDPSCSICLNSYEENELLRRLCCGHSYHAVCIDPWLRTNASCPKCRKRARISDIPLGPLNSTRQWVRSVLSCIARFHSRAVRYWGRDGTRHVAQ
jgi:hypothetical protein